MSPGPATPPTCALIIGGAHGSLAIARSLAPRGIAVDVAANHALPVFSRHVRRRFAWADGARDDALAALIALAEREGLRGAVLFAGGDSEVRFVAENHAALAGVFRLTTPPWNALARMFDKRLMHAHAAAIGIDSPVTYAPRSACDLDDMPCRFPLVLKPTVRTVENAFTLAKAWRADDRATLKARYAEAAALVGEDGIVLQELIPGNGEAQYSYAAVFDRGAAVASLVARRRRQYPLEFGYTSTFVETAERPEVEAAGQRFLASLDYTGIAEVEFKRDRRDGRYKILDVNTRIWTWAALGPAAGVDFAHVQWRLACGEAVAPVRASRDAAWIHASRDLVAAGRQMLTGSLSPRAYLGSFARPLTFAAFALDDPLPGLVELPLALWRALTHRLPILVRDVWRLIVLADAPLKPERDSPCTLARRRHRRLRDPAR